MPGPTAYEYAQMCVAVYARAGHGTQIRAKRGSWQFLSNSPMNDFGYYGAVYRNEETRQIVIAHCGTDASVFANLRADLQIGLGREPVAYQFVAGFSDGIHADYATDGYEITETGHSLGAIYAELNAIRFRCKAVTFESPGSRGLMTEPQSDVDITTYLSAPNFINTSGEHLGTVFRLYPPHVETTGLRVEDIQGYANYLSLFYITADYIRLIATLGTDIFQYTQRLHSMEGLLSVFDPNLHAPRLQSQPMTWPSRMNFLNSTLWTYLHPVGKYHLYVDRFLPWLTESFNSLFRGGEGRTVAKNIRLEDNLYTFISNCPRPQAFLMPSAEHCEGVPMPDIRQFVRRSRQELLTFYNPNNEEVSYFDRDLANFTERNHLTVTDVTSDQPVVLDIQGDYDEETITLTSGSIRITDTMQSHGAFASSSPSSSSSPAASSVPVVSLPRDDESGTHQDTDGQHLQL